MHALCCSARHSLNFCFILCIGYMWVVWKPLSILTPFSLVGRNLYLHSVHLYHAVACIYAVSNAAKHFCMLKKVESFCHVALLGNLCPMLYGLFVCWAFAKLDEMIELFLLVLYHKVYYVYTHDYNVLFLFSWLWFFFIFYFFWKLFDLSEINTKNKVSHSRIGQHSQVED